MYVMTQLIQHLHSLVLSVGPFFILLGLLIFVHELGHFLVAKYYGVRVETFSMGFGKKILSVKRGDTVYCVSLIPLGGYVKMYGDDPSKDIPEDQKSFSFLHKPLGQRVAIVLAGPIMNLFFAAVLYIAIAGLGEEVAAPVLGDLQTTTVAYESGFRPGDKILSVANSKIGTWRQMRDLIAEAPGKVLEFQVERDGEAHPLEITAPVGLGPNENIFSRQRQIGQIEGFGQDSRSSLVGIRDPKGVGNTAGIQNFDMIVAVNGEKISYWRDLEPAMKKAVVSGNLKVTVQDLTQLADEKAKRELDIPFSKKWDEKTSLIDALGLETAELFIYQVKEKSPAGLAGIQKGDRVLRINNEDVYAWTDVLNKVKAYGGEAEGMKFTLLRAGSEMDLQITPEMTELMTINGKEEKRFTIGIVSGFFPAPPPTVFYRASSVAEMLKVGLKDTYQWSEFVVMSLVRLVQGEVSAKNVGGVITIGRVASHSFAAGLSTFLKTMAVISINLFILNLLPVPVLDGGHLVFYAIEALKGAPLSMRKMELAQQVGLMLLMMLMVFALFNDITNLFNL